VQRLLAITKALADETRLRALCALRDGELCVCQIVALLELAPSTVSKHMSVLKGAGLVESTKSGRWVMYRLPGKGTDEMTRRALGLALDALEGSERTADDVKRLQKLKRMKIEDICCQYL
jgi:DNA-binding transcriptional ArsR family regulator